jgi:hypothetical protein
MKTRNNHTPRTAVPAFLTLPIEIRYEIYNLALTTPLLRLQETRARSVKPLLRRCVKPLLCRCVKPLLCRCVKPLLCRCVKPLLCRCVKPLLRRCVCRSYLWSCGKPKPLANLIECFTHFLSACHQIYDEAFPFLYHHVTLSIAKPLAFANGFLLRLGSTQISQLKSIEFDIGRMAPVPLSAVEGLNSLKFNHILMVFECYPELRNLDMARMKLVGYNRTNTFSSYAPHSCRMVTEVTPEQVLSSTSTTDVGDIWNSEDTKALSRTTLKLANGSLKGFRIFRELACVPTTRSKWREGMIFSITLRKV